MLPRKGAAMSSKRKKLQGPKPGIASAPLSEGADVFRQREVQKHVEQRLRLISKNLKERLLRITGPIPDAQWEEIVKDVLTVGQWLVAKEAERAEALKAAEAKPEDKPLIIVP